MKLTDEERSLAMPALAHGDWAAVYAEGDVERIVAARLAAVEAPHCPTCTCGCTCGYGGMHEPENPRCELNTDSSEAPA